MKPTEAQIDELLAVHKAETGVAANPNMHERQWLCAAFLRDYNASDLRMVIRHVRKTYNDRQYWMPVVRLRRLLGDLSTFDDLLGEARAVSRNVPPPASDRDKVLHATGRPTAQQTKKAEGVRKVGEIINSGEFKKFCELKKML